MDNKEQSFQSYRCTSCFKTWVEVVEIDLDDYEPAKKTLCDFCSMPGRTSKELLLRMVEVMDSASMADLPKFIKKLLNHIEIKE